MKRRSAVRFVMWSLAATVGCSGDLNCDGLVTADDVAPFASAVLNPAGFQPTACGATPDMNGDGKLDGLDIQQFIRSVLP